MDPLRLFLFVETPAFTTRWAGLRLTDYDLSVLQWTIMEHPQIGPVISGAGGFRKMRFATKRSGAGKSGGIRVIYLPSLRFRAVMLAFAYAKNEIATLNESGKRALARQALEFETILEDFFQRHKR